MKRLFFLTILLSFCSCGKTKDYYISLDNNSDNSISFDWDWKYPVDSTSILIDIKTQPRNSIAPHETRVIAGGISVKKTTWYQNFYLSKTEGGGYISFFIVDTHALDSFDFRSDNHELWVNSCERIQKEYDNMVIARYDILQSEIEDLDWVISFPPTPDMVQIHMWPPYDSLRKSFPFHQ